MNTAVLKETISQRLGSFVKNQAYGALPAEVVANAKMRILDTLGVCLASIDMEYARAIHDFCSEQGGSPTSGLIGRPGRLPESWAVLYNGSLAHGNDYDDTHSGSIIHIGGAVVPSALAMSEKMGRNGADMITAVVSGYEVAARLGMAASKGFHIQGFHPTGVCGAFSSAAVASKLMDLSPMQIANAFGIAGSQASGSMEFLDDGAWTKRMHPGWAAHAGITAAGLASRGFKGPARTFEGRYGLYKLYANTVKPDLLRATAELNHEWEILNTDFKPYPCGHISHPYMDCALKLRNQHSLKPEQIESIQLYVPTEAVQILCEPLADKRKPVNAYAARFSLPYAVAVVLIEGKAGIDEFSESEIRRPEVLALCAKTEYTIDDTLPFPASFPGRIAIRMKDGATYEMRMDHSRGSRENPMSENELHDKFMSNAVRVFSASHAERIWAAGYSLEKLEDVSAFAKLLSQSE